MKVVPTVQAETTITVCAVIVAGVWGFRTLYETGKSGTELTSGAKEGKSQLQTLAGMSAHPAAPAEFIVGFGFVFFSLSVIALPAPELAKMFAVLIAVGTTLANGTQFLNDINSGVSTTTTLESGSTTQLATKPAVKSASNGENQTPKVKVTG
jgi:hypothetical protein